MSIGQVLLTGIVPNAPQYAHFGKDYYIDKDGNARSKPNGGDRYHSFDVKDVSSLLELRDGLRSITSNRNQCLILFAEPNELAKSTPKGQGLRRKAKSDDPKKPPTLDLAPSSIFMVDLDDYPIPEGEDYDTVAENAPNRLLAPCLRDVSFVLQMSASAKIKDVDQLKAHYFFRIVDPEGNPKAVKKEWLKALFEATAPKRPNWEEIKKKNALWWHDPAPFSAVQYIFTCAPNCQDGLQDPYKLEDRVRLIKRAHPALVITPELEALVEAYLAPSRPPEKIKLTGEAKKVSQSIKRERKARQPSPFLSVQLTQRYPSVEVISSAFHDLLESLKRDCLEVDEKRYPIIAEYAKKVPRHIHQREVGYEQARRLFIETAYQVRPKDRSELERLVDWHFNGYLSKRFLELEREEDARLQKLNHKAGTHEETARAVEVTLRDAVASAKAHPDRVQCAKLPTAAGKSYTAMKIALELAEKHPVIFALATNELADAKEKEAIKIWGDLNISEKGSYRSAPVQRVESKSSQCKTLTIGPEKDERRRQYGLLGKTLNKKEGSFCVAINCPDIDWCPVSDEVDRIGRGTEGLPSKVYFMTHAMLNAIAEDQLTEDTFIFYDEAPQQWHDKSIKLSQLEKVRDLDAGEEYAHLSVVADNVNVLIRKHLKGKGKVLVLDLDACLDSADLLTQKFAKRLIEEEEFAFPSMTKDDEARILQGGRPGIDPSTKAFMKAICRSLTGEETGLEAIARGNETDDPQKTIEMRPTFKTKRVNGKPLSTMILDATPTVTLKTIIEAEGREYSICEPEEGAIRAVSLNEAYHWKNSYLNNRRIFFEGEFKSGHAEHIEKIALSIEERLDGLDKGAKVAVLASKMLKEAIMSGKESLYQQKENRRSIGEVLAPFDVSYGHFFAESRASNRFQDCDALILLGSCRLELATAQARHRALVKRGCPLEFNAYYEEANRAEIDQAIGRGRSLRREVLTLVYGPVEPTKNEYDGMVWTTHSRRGREASAHRTRATDHARDKALLGGHISADQLLPFGVSISTAKRILNELEQDEKLTIIKLGKKKVLTIHPDYVHEVEARFRARPLVDDQGYYVSKDAEDWLNEEFHAFEQNEYSPPVQAPISKDAEDWLNEEFSPFEMNEYSPPVRAPVNDQEDFFSAFTTTPVQAPVNDQEDFFTKFNREACAKAQAQAERLKWTGSAQVY